MSVEIKSERVDARILSAKLTRDDVATALYEYVMRRAKIQAYEAEVLDRSKSTFSLTAQPGAADLTSACVTVRLDLSRLPQAQPEPRLPKTREVEELIANWNSAGNLTPLSEVVEKIRDLCR